MSKFWVIFKREYAQVVKKKSFLVGVLLTPALLAGIAVVPALLAMRGASETEQLAVIDQSSNDLGERFAKALEQYKLDDEETSYYNVQARIEIDPLDETRFTEVHDSLAHLISEKQLKYIVVFKPKAHRSDTGVFVVTNSDNFRTFNRFERRISDVLSSVRLNESNVNLSVDSVLHLTRRIDLSIRDAKGESVPFEVKYFSAVIFILIMFAMMIGYGQMVMRSVIEEKNSRIMEVLISSVSPFQLMFGKVMGLGAATLTQIAVWFLMGAGIYVMKGTLDISPSVDRVLFNPVIVIFFILFMISGYLLFSTIFALIGSIVNSEKEAQNFVMPVTLTLVLPLILAMYIIQEPNSTVSIVLSLIPFLTPPMMTMRVIFVAPTLSEYSLFSGIVGEAALGFILVCLTVVVMVWLTAKIFRIGILMYGKRPTLPEIVRWVRY